MRLLSVNVGLPKTVTLLRRSVHTAFFKEPVSGAIPLSRLGLRGDGQADPKYHGGPDKAVYLYPFEHYAYWSAVLGRTDLSPGAFGENLTTEGVLETETRIGDVLAIGSASAPGDAAAHAVREAGPSDGLDALREGVRGRRDGRAST